VQVPVCITGVRDGARVSSILTFNVAAAARKVTIIINILKIVFNQMRWRLKD
jgi:hypothetical protein